MLRPLGDLLLNPEYAGWFEKFAERLESDEFLATMEELAQQARDTDGDDDEREFWSQASWARPYKVSNGVLTIPVKGMLVDDFPYAMGGWITGYEYVTAAIRRGARDPMVNTIVLDVNSPGGTVSGCFTCADVIYEARQAKPIRAWVNDSGYSAAYALASSATSINLSRTGGVGSIGVIGRHMDYSGALEQAGLKVTFIYAGERKLDGRPELPLSDAAKAEWQKRVDASYDIFVATVARNRGITEEAVRATEAATFLPREAVEIGLADKVGPLGDLSAYADPLHQHEDEKMSKDNSAVDQAALDTATAQARAEGAQAGKAEGAKAERERIAAIVGCDEAKERQTQALTMALETDLTVDQAKALLGKSPKDTKAEAQAPANPFDSAMDKTGNPNLGAGSGDEAPKSRADSVFASAGFAPARN